MTTTRRLNGTRTAAVAVGYVLELVVLLIGVSAVARWADAADAALAMLMTGAAILSFVTGHAVRRFWILGVPAAISATLMVLVFELLSSGFPSYDNDPMLGLYALALPFVTLLVLAAPMALGVSMGRSSEESKPVDG